jgi:hypothetical protein
MTDFMCPYCGAMPLAWLRPGGAHIEKPPRPVSRGILFCVMTSAVMMILLLTEAYP